MIDKRAAARTAMLFGLAALLSIPPSTRADDAPDLTVARGLEYLARQQQPDGSFDSPDGGTPKGPVTAAALLAFLASGHTPDLGRYGLVVRGAADFLVKSSADISTDRPDATGGRPDGGRTIGQALVALALAEVDGAGSDPAFHASVRPALEKAVAALLKARDAGRSSGGGWGADGRPADDLMATAWALLALRSAQAAGVHVPRDVFDRAAAYVLKCYHADPKASAERRGFSNANESPSPAANAAGVLSLELLGPAERAELKDAMKLLSDADTSRLAPAALLMAQLAVSHPANASPPPAWKARSPLDDGGWPSTRSPSDPNAPAAAYDPAGRVWPTAINALILSMPYRLLPLDAR